LFAANFLDCDCLTVQAVRNKEPDEFSLALIPVRLRAAGLALLRRSVTLAGSGLLGRLSVVN
jgi:hypothetical protein